MRMDTFTVYSTFDWDQLVKNSRPHAHGWRERLKISKEDQFERDLLKTAEDMAPQKSPNFTVVCIFGGVSQYVKQ